MGPGGSSRVLSMRPIPSDNLDDEQPSDPPEVRMFWTGPPLSLYELLSLQSFIAAGARVSVYSTSKTLRVPEGVELLDARELWPGPVHRFFYPDGDPSSALHSDLVRYVMLHRFGGWYADLDMICLRRSTDQQGLSRVADRPVSKRRDHEVSPALTGDGRRDRGIACAAAANRARRTAHVAHYARAAAGDEARSRLCARSCCASDIKRVSHRFS